MTRATFKKGAKIERWERNLDKPSDALKQIGALMVSESQRAFKLQKFGKNPWEPRGPVNVYGVIADFAAGKRAPPNRRFESTPVLMDTGRLRNTIAARLVGSHVVEVGSDLPYASVLQHGGAIESETITESVQKLLWSWLKTTKGKDHQSDLGFLLNKKYTGKTLKGTVPARPFVGITKQTIDDVKEAVGVKIMEVK